jgi:2Fe-2S ferredoxin
MAEVHIQNDNLTLEATPGETIIELCERRRGTSIIFGCRNASCGSCLVSVVQGAENLSVIEPREQALLKCMYAEPNDRLACQCKILGNIALSVP